MAKIAKATNRSLFKSFRLEAETSSMTKTLQPLIIIMNFKLKHLKSNN